MSKNKIKNLKNMVSSLDINKLYKLQEYVSVSQVFFKELEVCINNYNNSCEMDSDLAFTADVLNLYYSMKDKLKVK